MTAEATLLASPTLASLRAELHDELVERILPYWMRQGVDERNGGFAFEDLSQTGRRSFPPALRRSVAMSALSRA